MREIFYDSISDFENDIKANEVINVREGTIYIKDDAVYKIFNTSSRIRYYGSIENIGKLEKLDSNMFTIPIGFVYINGKFFGIKMINAGISIWHKFLMEDLTFEEKKLISYQLKDISEYLKHKHLVHGDINLGNVLYLDSIVRLADINGMLNYANKFDENLKHIRIPEILYSWFLTYGIKSIDYLEVNLCMHILFNFSKEELNKKFTADDSPINYRKGKILINKENTAFDDDVYAYFKDCFNQNQKKLSLNTYLVDYLK